MKKLVIGMLAHVDAGKTTLSEALLFHAGAIRRMGRVDNRNSFLDTHSIERERGITVFSKQAILSMPEMSITLMDTPGHVDFSAETERTFSVLDYAALVISGADGVQDHTGTLWTLLAHYHVPTFLFVNKMDQNGTDEQSIMRQLRSRLSDCIVNLTHPDYEDISLLDENLLTSYLETGSIDSDKYPSLIAERRMFPCFFGSALKDTGVEQLLQAIREYTVMPDYPQDFGARVFKITYAPDRTRLTHLKITGGTLSARQDITDTAKVNQIRLYSGERFTTVPSVSAGEICAVTGLDESYAGQCYGNAFAGPEPVLEPVLTYRVRPNNIDSVQLLPKIRMLEEEDPALHVLWKEESKEIHIQVMGNIRLEILRQELLSRFQADVSFDTGTIVYKETIQNTVEGVGHFEPLRHYAEVHLMMEPLPRGTGLEFTSNLSTDLLATNWQRLIMTHLAEKRHRGVLTGSFLTDVRFTLVAGKAHPKHTEGGDFRQATYRAVRQGLMQADNVLLEPYFAFRITLPEECLGRVMHDLELLHATFSREADLTDNTAVLCGRAPVSTFRDYPSELPAVTKGRGHVSWRVDGYEPCHNTEEVIASRGYNPDTDLRNPSSSVFCTHGSGFPVLWYDVPNYMHLPFSYAERDSNESEYVNALSAGEDNNDDRPGRPSLTEALDISLGTEEIDAILQQATHANARKERPAAKRNYEPKLYRGTETKQSRPSYLLVDGYNIIHAWPELNTLSADNMDAARGLLLDRLCNYKAYHDFEVIVVFDAYRLKGHDTEFFDYHNIHVVYTKEAETADRYIERFTHVHESQYHIRVATSDGLEQIIIRGAGSLVVSAREFAEEVQAAEERIREHL